VTNDGKTGVYSLRRRRLACENTRFDIFLDDIEGADGEITDNYLVVAPKVVADDLVTGVAVLPVMDGRLGLLRIYRHALGRCLWEIPRGFVDPGESDRVSALRELEEETGLSCAPDDLEHLGHIAPEPGIIAARVRLFAARRCSTVRPFRREEFGHMDFRLFEPDQVLSLHGKGEIQDSATLAAYLLYRIAPAK